MKKILFLFVITAIVQKNYCQTSTQFKDSRKSYHRCLHADVINNTIMNDTITKCDSTMLILRGYRKPCKTILSIMPLPFNTAVHYSIDDMYKYREALKGMRIPF